MLSEEHSNLNKLVRLLEHLDSCLSQVGNKTNCCRRLYLHRRQLKRGRVFFLHAIDGMRQDTTSQLIARGEIVILQVVKFSSKRHKQFGLGG